VEFDDASPRRLSARIRLGAVGGDSCAASSKNGAVSISAQKSFVTSAGHGDGYVVSTFATSATQPIESTIYARGRPRIDG
jgi:hypothetical protein